MAECFPNARPRTRYYVRTSHTIISLTVEACVNSLKPAEEVECIYSCAEAIKNGCCVVASTSVDDHDLPTEMSDTPGDFYMTVVSKEVEEDTVVGWAHIVDEAKVDSCVCGTSMQAVPWAEPI